MPLPIARARLRLLYVLFRFGLWCTEAIGLWMVRLATLYRAIVRYEGNAQRAIVVIGGGATLMLWGATRLAFLGFYRPTHRIQRTLTAAGW